MSLQTRQPAPVVSRGTVVRFAAVLVLTALAAACGGSSTSPTGTTGAGGSTGGSGSTPTTVNNVLPLVVSGGPTGNYLNGLFASVTLCVPGSTTNCQTIDNLLVDTGSSGVRVLASALTLALPQQVDVNGRSIGECEHFLDSYTWGPVQTATVKLAGEQASSVPIQVIGTPSFAPAPSACTSSGLPPANTLATLGANGILGLGLYRQDCGLGCAVTGSVNPGLYFSCAGATCTTAVQALTLQVQNPVWLFPQDNNGVVISLPALLPSGALTVSGSLFFGVGTQTNNALGAAKVLTTDARGTVTTTFRSQAYTGTFLDSGSNGMFFLDSTTTGLPLCRTAPDFYCPPTLQNLTASMQGANGASQSVAFSVASAESLSGLFNAFNNVAGPHPGSFDWGLPFFFGRSVFTAIEGQSTPGGPGPYWAF